MKSISALALGLALAVASSIHLHAAVAYVVPGGTPGTQNFGGALGMDFNVLAPGGITVTRLGAFDSNQDGINGTTLEVGIFDRDTATLVGDSVSLTGLAGSLEDGSRFITLTTPIVLPGGFQGSIVAQGYNDTEMNGNFGTGSVPGTTNDLGGAIEFVGGSRFGDPAAGLAFPGSEDGGPANRYHAGTFDYVPEPSSSLLLISSLGLLGLRRRR